MNPQPPRNPLTNSATKTAGKTEFKFTTKPAGKTESATAAKSVNESATKPAGKSESKSAAKSVNESATKTAGKTESATAAKSVNESAKTIAAKSESESAKTESKPAAKTVAKTESKSATKIVAKTESKTAAKTESESAKTIDAKSESESAKTESKSAEKSESKSAKTPARASRKSAGGDSRESRMVSVLRRKFGRRASRGEDGGVDVGKMEQLFKHGQENRYVTYADINDHLPDGIEDSEDAVNFVANMLREWRIPVYETPPDRDDLLMKDEGMQVRSDSDIEDMAEAAISSFVGISRTTDPVRMYMREMSSSGVVFARTRSGSFAAYRRRSAADYGSFVVSSEYC